MPLHTRADSPADGRLGGGEVKWRDDDTCLRAPPRIARDAATASRPTGVTLLRHLQELSKRDR